MFETQLFVGDKISTDEFEIRPLARLLRMNTPFFGVIWLRPVGIQIEHTDGRDQTIRVRDENRRRQLGFGLLLTITAWLFLKFAGRS